MAQGPVGDQKACDGCGRYHGSVTVLIECLSRELSAKRSQVRVLQNALVDARKTLQDIRSLVGF